MPMSIQMSWLRILRRTIHLRVSRLMRIVLGTALIIGGLLGFLPVLGFWMLPLGLAVLSIDLPIMRRFHRRLVVWWGRRKGARTKPLKVQE